MSSLYKKYKITINHYDENGLLESTEEIKIPEHYNENMYEFKGNFESWLRGINVVENLNKIENNINKTGTYSYKYQVGNPQHGYPWRDVIIEITNNIKEKQKIINKKIKKVKNA